jgi:hypothetical protein
MKKILSIAAVFIVTFFLTAAHAHAAADITITSATITTSNTVIVTTANANHGLSEAIVNPVDETKWHIDQNDGGVSPLTPTSASVISTGGNPTWIGRVALTFSGTPFADPATAYDAAHGLYIDASGLGDNDGDTNVVIPNSSSILIHDGQRPTLTDISIASNNTDPSQAKTGDTVTLTFTSNETLDGINSYVSFLSTFVNISGTLTNTSGNTWTATYVMQSGDPEGVIEFEIDPADPAGNTPFFTDTTDASSVTYDETPPSLFEITPVSSPSTDTTPTYVFNSDTMGTITYGGDCTSSTTTTGFGPNTITFERMRTGVHSNCTISLSDAAGNSATLNVTPFTISPSSVSTSEGAGAGYTTNPNDIPGTGQVVTPASPSPVPVSNVCVPYLIASLRQGTTSDDVSKLQTFLKDNGFFTYPSITHFFGPVTFQAVKVFQTKYAADILTPQQLTQPTGLVLGFTLKKINEVMCTH